MGARTLTRWQKASAIVPMAVLLGAWGVALNNSSLASASGGITGDAIPDVPSTPFEQPASVAPTPGGIDQRAGAAGTVSTLSTNGIPSAALYAYRRAETLLGKADKSCNLPWNLVAAIGRVESNHGRSDGNSLTADGLAKPGIYGVLLDGKDGRAKISDTDNGALDKSSVLDRAIGPMQFIPGTWMAVAVDSDNDDKKNPQDIDDAATSAGIYLCAGSENLSTDNGTAAAVKRYNRSDSYVDLVMSISQKYADGDFTQSSNNVSASSVLTNQSNDQTLTPSQRAKAQKAETRANNKPKPNGNGGSGSGGSGTDNGGGTGGTGTGGTGTGGILPGGGGGTGGGSGGGGGSPLDPVTKPLGDVTKPITKPLEPVLDPLCKKLTVAQLLLKGIVCK